MPDAKKSAAANLSMRAREQIAANLGVSVSLVGKVYRGVRKSKRVEKEILLAMQGKLPERAKVKPQAAAQDPFAALNLPTPEFRKKFLSKENLQWMSGQVRRLSPEKRREFRKDCEAILRPKPKKEKRHA